MVLEHLYMNLHDSNSTLLYNTNSISYYSTTTSTPRQFRVRDDKAKDPPPPPPQKQQQKTQKTQQNQTSTTKTHTQPLTHYINNQT